MDATPPPEAALTSVDRALLWAARHTVLGRGRARERIVRLLRRRLGDSIFAVKLFGFNASVALDNATDFKTLCNPKRHNAIEIAFLAAALREAGPEAVFVDVGANTGLVSLGVLAQAPEARAAAIEPNPKALVRARRNLGGLNPSLAPRVRVIESAVGETAGQAALLTETGQLGSVRLAEGGATPVRLAVLSDLLAEASLTRVDAMKIDIEGGEAAALTPYFTACAPAMKPRALVIEKQDHGGAALLDLLAAQGYVLRRTTRNNLLYARDGAA